MNIFISGLLFGVMCPFSQASVVSVDSLFVSTISGQSTGNGISISSPIFVNGSSITLRGSQGYIISESSITAASFFGDGRALSNLTCTTFDLTADHTFTGSNTFASTLTVQSGGRPIVLSTSTSVNNIAISSSGVLSFFPELHNSSSTIVPAGSTTAVLFGPCIGGSTITITTTGGRVEVTLSGRVYDDVAGKVAGATFLQDGKYPPGFDNVKSLIHVAPSGGNVIYGAIGTFSFLLDAPAPGTHSYCVTLRSSGAGSTAYLANDSDSGNLFYVKEIK